MPNQTATKTVHNNELIIQKDDQANAAFEIIQGAVAVYLEKDGKIVTLAKLGEGAIFGEMALYSGNQYGAHVKATEDNTILNIITLDILNEKLSTTDPLIVKILEASMNRLQSTNSALLESETRDYIEIDLI